MIRCSDSEKWGKHNVLKLSLFKGGINHVIDDLEEASPVLPYHRLCVIYLTQPNAHLGQPCREGGW